MNDIVVRFYHDPKMLWLDHHWAPVPTRTGAGTPDPLRTHDEHHTQECPNAGHTLPQPRRGRRRLRARTSPGPQAANPGLDTASTPSACGAGTPVLEGPGGIAPDCRVGRQQEALERVWLVRRWHDRLPHEPHRPTRRGEGRAPPRPRVRREGPHVGVATEHDTGGDRRAGAKVRPQQGGGPQPGATQQLAAVRDDGERCPPTRPVEASCVVPVPAQARPGTRSQTCCLACHASLRLDERTQPAAACRAVRFVPALEGRGQRTNTTC